MKKHFELTVREWETPDFVYTKEGASIPIKDVDVEIVQKLCMKWIDDVCTRTGMTFEIVFDMFKDGGI